MGFTSYTMFLADCEARGAEYAAARSARLGFDAVELLDCCPLSASPRTPIVQQYAADELRSILTAQGLFAGCFSVCTTLTDWDRDAFADMEKLTAYAAALGSPYLHHTLVLPLERPAGAPGYDEIFDTVLTRAAAVADMAKGYGIACLYEPQGMYFNGAEGLGRFLDALHSRCGNVGVCMDTGNPLFVDADPLAVIQRLSPHIRHLHVKDYIVSDTPLAGRQGYRSRGGKYLYDCPIGEGCIDISGCMAALRQAGYIGQISLEAAAPQDADALAAMEYLKSL